MKFSISEISNDDISGMDRPINFVFHSKCLLSAASEPYLLLVVLILVHCYLYIKRFLCYIVIYEMVRLWRMLLYSSWEVGDREQNSQSPFQVYVFVTRQGWQARATVTWISLLHMHVGFIVLHRFNARRFYYFNENLPPFRKCRRKPKKFGATANVTKHLCLNLKSDKKK